MPKHDWVKVDRSLLVALVAINLEWLIFCASPAAAADPLITKSSASAVGIDTIVVRPPAWGAALKEWKAYRELQGHRVAELDAGPDSQAIRGAIAQLCAGQAVPPRYVLLAGDVTAHADSTVPTFYHTSTAMSQFGGDEKIASDNPYGDMDDDSIPEMAVGRIPADTAEQLRAALARVMAFEQHQDYSTWRRDVHVVAGVGGFGALADSVIEMTTRRFLSDRIPGWSDITMTQASTKSHYCPDPWRFSEACIARLNQGGMFWVYIGHGHVKTLDYVRVGQEWLPILTHEHVPAVNVGNHPPIAIFLACYTGAFDAIEDSLAEELVLSTTGPIAALAASRVSGPYGLAMLSDGLLSSCFEQQTHSLGEVILHAKQKLLQPKAAENNPAREAQMQMIGAIASAMCPEGYDLEAERREHVWEMNLLGDPLLRLCHPGALTLSSNDRAVAGESLVVSGSSDIAGGLSIELVLRREQVRKELEQLEVTLDSLEGRNAFQQRYQSANARVLVHRKLHLQSPGEFQVELPIPADLSRGKYAIRAFHEGDTAWRVGYREIAIRPEQ